MSIQMPETEVNIKDLVLDEPPKEKDELDPNNLVTDQEWQTILGTKEWEVSKSEHVGPVLFDLLSIKILGPEMSRSDRDKSMNAFYKCQRWVGSPDTFTRVDRIRYATALSLINPKSMTPFTIMDDSSNSAYLSEEIGGAQRQVEMNLMQGPKSTDMYWLNALMEALVSSKVLYPDQFQMPNISTQTWQQFGQLITRSSELITRSGDVNAQSDPTLAALGYRLFCPSDIIKFSPALKGVEDAVQKVKGLRGKNFNEHLDEFLKYQATIKILLSDSVVLEPELNIVISPKEKLSTPESPVPEARRF